MSPTAKEPRQGPPAYYPVFINLEGQPCLLIGGGKVASQKVEPLLRAGARVTVVAPHLSEPIQYHFQRKRVSWLARPFRDEDLADRFLVIAASNQPDVHQRVYELCRERRILVNVVDETQRCNFIVPSIARSGPVQVAVSTSGTSPTLAKRLRREIQRAFLGDGIGRLSAYLGRWRQALKARFRDFEEKRTFWNRVFESAAPGQARRGDWQAADRTMCALIGETESKPPLKTVSTQRS